MYAVRFLENGTDGRLYGTYGLFSTAEKAAWWARQECDGKTFQVVLLKEQ